MRPDTRSFSFTWLRGQKSSENIQHEQIQEEDEPPQGESVSGESSKDINAVNSDWAARRGSTGSRLRRLGNSLARLGGAPKYASMGQVVEEENWQKITEEPMLMDEDEDDYDDVVQDSNVIPSVNEPDVVRRVTMASISTVTAPAVFRPLQPLDHNIVEITAKDKDGGLSLGKRLNKTVQDVKASFGNFSQKFRRSTRRRYRMGPGTPGSMASPTRRILGRTPTKLYSPFGIDSPANLKTPKRLMDRPPTPRLTRKSLVSGLVYSPSNNFRRDVDEARRGLEDFHMISRDITRRSVRF